MLADGKSGDVVERVGHKLCALGEIRHFQALGVFGRIERLAAFPGYAFDKLGGFRMADDGQIQSSRCGLARAVVGRGADAAGNERRYAV
ncbi:Uncharacterised protein [Neisseria gonorrhoeae]|nr:Uncharacterised protein [Neisseria gonorrhoeae]